MNNIQFASFDLNLLKVFDAVLSTRSNRAAAARLNVSQSAISHSLKKLRQRFGDPLLVPGGGEMRPTPFAEGLAPVVRRALDELASLSAASPLDPRHAKRAFTVASADFASMVVVPPLCAALGREAPGIDLRVRAPPTDVFDELQSGRYDLALGVFREAPAGFRRQVILEDRFVCVARQGHQALRGRFTLERYLECEHVAIAPLGGAWTFVDEALTRKKRARRIRLVVPHFLTVPVVLAETDLIAMLPEPVARRTAEAWGLQIVPPPFEVEKFQLAQLWHERTQADALHAWLRRRVAELSRK